MKHWLEPIPVDVPEALRRVVGGHPLIAEALARRGLTDPEAALAFLEPDRFTAPSASDLPDFDRAVDRLAAAVTTAEPIAVWGDFDVDGQTATALLVDGLRTLGAAVHFHIPLRETGHGIHRPDLDRLIDGGARLLLTCDTGIAAHDAIAHAADRGVTVIVSDHHNLAPTLPDRAYALVNPKRLADKHHPLFTLPGVGVAYLIIEALFARFDRPGADRYRDLVALGIVADVAEQVGVTRWLLQRGLATLTDTPRIGLRALLDNAGLTGSAIREEQIGFQIGPRLNALGRLGDAAEAVELLTTTDPTRALVLAGQLESLNAERRLLTEQVTTAAQAMIDREPALLDTDVLVLAGADWHPGVLGIVASRLVEAYVRPVIMLRLDADGTARGSARSVVGADIGAAIAACADLLISHGGHTGAAGVRLRVDQIDAFRRAVSRAVRRTFIRQTPTLTIEAVISLIDLTPAFAGQIERLAPFGAGNPPLTLALPNLTVQSTRAIGRTGDHRTITVADADGNTARVLWWGGGAQAVPDDRFDLAVTVRARDYLGKPDIQIQWLEARPAAGVSRLSRASTAIIDCRGAGAPSLGDLRRLHPDLVVWAEGPNAPPGSARRTEMTPASTLAIWTPPAAYGDLRETLRVVRPAAVYVYATDPGPMTLPKAVIEQVAGMVKYALRTAGGMATLDRMAAACAQREATTRAALTVLAAQGEVVVLDEGGVMQFAPGTGVRDEAELLRAVPILKALINETALFRAHWAAASIEALTADLRS